jgi:hypothetical protein
MKRLALLLAVVAVLAFVSMGSLFAAEEGKAPGGGRGGIMGEVTKIDGKTLTVTSKREGATPKTVTVEESTEVFSQAAVKLADIKVGDRVRITQGDKTVSGEVTKIEDKNKVTVKGRKDEQTVTVGEGDTIMGSVKGKFEDIKVGSFVMVRMKDDKAVRVDIQQPRKAPEK